MGFLAWTKASDKERAGVDHLGMRVAGEQAYSAMTDFNTTVAWRPRYYSFFCWRGQMVVEIETRQGNSK